MSWYRWHQASFAICLLSLFLPSSTKPICSTFAVIMCLPSSWHIRGRHQATFTPFSPPPPPPHAPLFTPLFPRPLCHRVLERVQVASCPSLFDGARTENKEAQKKGTKNFQKYGCTPLHILFGAHCSSSAHRLGVRGFLLLLLLLISMFLPLLDGKNTLLENLGTFLTWCY